MGPENTQPLQKGGGGKGADPSVPRNTQSSGDEEEKRVAKRRGKIKGKKTGELPSTNMPNKN